MRALVCFSVTKQEAQRLAQDGPRRDITSLAERLCADVLYRQDRARRGPRWLRRLAGPHVRDAWAAASGASKYDVVFADGEHIGLPLLFFLAARRRRHKRVVILGHLIDRPWKRLLLRAGSQLVPGGVLVVHSTVQGAIARGSAHKSWSVEILPYQVDAQFWARTYRPVHGRPHVVAVGSESRDYATLAQAVDGLGVDATIAAGSHWARKRASAASVPENVTYLDRTLTFAELRELYTRADVVVVPLQPVSNQSGVTGILEAMSMSCATVVTATTGQTEVVTGPLVTAEGFDSTATVTRGPQLFGFEPDPGPTGWYVTPHDVDGLRTAILRLIGDADVRQDLGNAARASVERNFRVEQFAERFADVIQEVGGTK